MRTLQTLSPNVQQVSSQTKTPGSTRVQRVSAATHFARRNPYSVGKAPAPAPFRVYQQSRSPIEPSAANSTVSREDLSPRTPSSAMQIGEFFNAMAEMKDNVMWFEQKFNDMLRDSPLSVKQEAMRQSSVITPRQVDWCTISPESRYKLALSKGSCDDASPTGGQQGAMPLAASELETPTSENLQEIALLQSQVQAQAEEIKELAATRATLEQQVERVDSELLRIRGQIGVGQYVCVGLLFMAFMSVTKWWWTPQHICPLM